MPKENVIESAKRSSKYPLSFAISSVFNPRRRNKPKIISATVAIVASPDVMDGGNQGLIRDVYSRKLFQFPQADISDGYNPKRSATADRKAVDSASRRKILTIRLYIAHLVELQQIKAFCT